MTIKLSEDNINNINLQIFNTQHEKLEMFAAKQGFDNFKAQIFNALEVLKHFLTFKISWQEADFFWTDKKIRQFLNDEVSVISKKATAPNDRLLEVLKKIKQTVNICNSQESLKGSLKSSIENLNKIEIIALLTLKRLKTTEPPPPQTPSETTTPKEKTISDRLAEPTQKTTNISIVAGEALQDTAPSATQSPTLASRQLKQEAKPPESPSSTVIEKSEQAPDTAKPAASKKVPPKPPKVTVAKEGVGRFSIMKLLKVGLLVYTVLRVGSKAFQSTNESIFKMHVVDDLTGRLPPHSTMPIMPPSFRPTITKPIFDSENFANPKAVPDLEYYRKANLSPREDLSGLALVQYTPPPSAETRAPFTPPPKLTAQPSAEASPQPVHLKSEPTNNLSNPPMVTPSELQEESPSTSVNTSIPASNTSPIPQVSDIRQPEPSPSTPLPQETPEPPPVPAIEAPASPTAPATVQPFTFGMPKLTTLIALATAVAGVARYAFRKNEKVKLPSRLNEGGSVERLYGINFKGISAGLGNVLSAYVTHYQPQQNRVNLEKYIKSKAFKKHAKTARIYYNSKQMQPTDALRIIYQREPTNIAMGDDDYNPDNLKNSFGYRKGVFNDPQAKKVDGSSFKALPNTCAVYSETFLWKLPEKPGSQNSQEIEKIAIACLSLPAPALDTSKQPHFNYYMKWHGWGRLDTEKYENEIQFLFQTVEKALRDNQHTAFRNTGIKRLVLSKFGQSAFLEGLKPADKREANRIFLKQLDRFLERIRETGVDVVLSEHKKPEGDDSWSNHVEMLYGDIINTSRKGDLIINAWDPHSAPGNGNDEDRSFDGAMGKASGILPTQTAWLNPHLRKTDALVDVYASPIQKNDEGPGIDEEIEEGETALETFAKKGKGDPDEGLPQPVLKKPKVKIKPRKLKLKRQNNESPLTD